MPSSVILGMLYSPALKTLDIAFRGARGTYRYYEVSAEEWRAFKRSQSKGTYLNAVFKKSHPRFERLIAMRRGIAAEIAGTFAAPADAPDENVWGFHDDAL